MSIKPVLVPDQDAKTLRSLLESFDAAATGPVKQQLTESAESENLAIGEKMARDGIEYDPAQEGEIISQIGDYLRRDGMTARQVRGYMIDPDFISDQLSYLPRKSGIAEADVPYNDPNLSKAYTLGNEAYTKLKNHPELAQAAQDRIEKEFPQYARMWLTGYRDGERFDQEKNMSEASPPGVFKQGDKVKVHGKFDGTIVGQDGDTYYVQIDGQPGSQAVTAASLAKPAAGGFKPGAKLMYKGQPVTYIRPFAQDPGQSYVKIASGSDELVATADLQAAAVAESRDPIEQLRADIQRFAR